MDNTIHIPTIDTNKYKTNDNTFLYTDDITWVTRMPHFKLFLHLVTNLNVCDILDKTIHVHYYMLLV